LRFSYLKSHALGLAVIVAVAAARAADPESTPHDSRFAVSLEAPPPDPVVFWQRFDSAFEDNANDTFADALQPLNVVRWNVDLPGRDFSENFHAIASRRARGALVRTVEYGSREAAVEIPFMLWLDDHQGWVAHLLRDSIDNVGEEADKPLDVSRQDAQFTTWRAEANSGTHYGIRPLRTSPYAYVSHGFSDGQRTFLLARVRYYYDRFADHRVELALSAPIAYGVMFNVGSSYEFGAHDEQKLVVKLIKDLKGVGVAQVGFQVRNRPELIAGISFPW
jgi:hypothetical protein